jgi:hypothetical protein
VATKVAIRLEIKVAAGVDTGDPAEEDDLCANVPFVNAGLYAGPTRMFSNQLHIMDESNNSYMFSLKLNYFE